VECYWQEKAEVLGDNLPQWHFVLRNVLACGRARACSLRGWRPTAWATVRTIFSFILIRYWFVKFVGDSHLKTNYFRYRRLRRKRSHDRRVHPCGTMSLEQEDSSPAFWKWNDVWSYVHGLSLSEFILSQ